MKKQPKARHIRLCATFYVKQKRGGKLLYFLKEKITMVVIRDNEIIGLAKEITL